MFILQVHITSAIQCSGNRRANMNAYKKVQGLMWKETAISNAKWTGVRLRVGVFVPKSIRQIDINERT